MRLPLRDRRPGAAHRPFASPNIASMPEGEIDGVRERPVPEHNKSARCAVGLSRRRCERTHSATARGYTQFSTLSYLDTSMDPQDI